MSLTSTVARNIRDVRKFRRLTAEALAELCPRLDRAAISKIENGLRRITTDDLDELAQALLVDPSTLLGEIEYTTTIRPLAMIGEPGRPPKLPWDPKRPKPPPPKPPRPK